MKEIDTNTKQPLVSVIMPTYNHARFIGEAIDSVLNQTYKNLELIIIDNYSKDNTEKIVASYKDDRIKYLKFKNNGVIAASRNYGIRHSKGEYIAFLDSDDKWVKCKLERQLSCFKDNTIMGVATDVAFESPIYYKRTYFGKSKKGYKLYHYHDLLHKNLIVTSSVVVKKDTLLSVGNFDENPDFIFIEDWDLWLRLTKIGIFYLISKPLTIYRLYHKNNRNQINIIKNQLKIIKKHKNLGYISNKEVDKAKANIYFVLACKSFILDAQISKKYFSMAYKISDLTRIKLKLAMGIFLCKLPRIIRNIIFYLIHTTNRYLRYL